MRFATLSFGAQFSTRSYIDDRHHACNQNACAETSERRSDEEAQCPGENHPGEGVTWISKAPANSVNERCPSGIFNFDNSRVQFFAIAHAQIHTIHYPLYFYLLETEDTPSPRGRQMLLFQHLSEQPLKRRIQQLLFRSSKCTPTDSSHFPMPHRCEVEARSQNSSGF